jgi:dienelactone hydrolase
MNRVSHRKFWIGCALVILSSGGGVAGEISPLPGTQPLTLQGDIASNLVAGVDRFLLSELEKSVEGRAKFWKRDFSSEEAYNTSIATNRARLRHILGVRDVRKAFDGPELVGTTTQPALVGRGTGYEVYAIRWPAFGDVHGEGLLCIPSGPKAVADIVAIPDCEQTPEQLLGLVEGVPASSQFARRLAESGCRVVVPVLIDRSMGPHKGRAKLTGREFLYRSAYELGRHLVGYEVQKVLAAVDWFANAPAGNSTVGVIGYGEGGLLALYAGALDSRIHAVTVCGYFDDRRDIWQGPIDRNVFGLLEQFGDAELASMVAPRLIVVEACKAPESTITGNGGGGPAKLVTPELERVRKEVERARELVKGCNPQARIEVVASKDGLGPCGSSEALEKFLAALDSNAKLAEVGKAPEHLRQNFDPKPRQQAQFHEIDRHNQWLLTESGYTREEFLKKLDTSSVEKYEQSVTPYRKFFYEEVIGHFETPVLPPNVRSRTYYESNSLTCYEVVMDVYPDVIAYGLLLVPKDIKPGEKRPVVVCQHGLEGRPQDTIGEPGKAYYSAFSTRLAERGFVTFAPQNLYIFGDRFRTLQRKANPLKKTLYSIITPQHQQIVDWLETLPFVDPQRIAFYGLSYGGKTAMRVPALVTDYCLSICSADFNEWVWKNASTRSGYSYVWGGEYEIFEFDLGSTFNYAEMAALIAPRPFMVERGHFDGVAPDETVGYEYAKILRLYAARLKIPDRTEIEWFVGPHSINGKGTYKFLHKQLKWPEPQ